MNVKNLVKIIRAPLEREDAKEAAVEAVKDYLEEVEAAIRNFVTDNPSAIRDVDIVAVPIISMGHESRTIECYDVKTVCKRSDTNNEFSNENYVLVRKRENGFYFDESFNWKKYSDSKWFFNYVIEELVKRGFYVALSRMDESTCSAECRNKHEEDYGPSYVVPQIFLDFDIRDTFEGEFDEDLTAAYLAEVFRVPQKAQAAKTAVENYMREAADRFTKFVEENPEQLDNECGVTIPITGMECKSESITTADIEIIDGRIMRCGCKNWKQLEIQDGKVFLVSDDVFLGSDEVDGFTDSFFYFSEVIKTLKDKGFGVYADFDEGIVYPYICIYDDYSDLEDED